jgi:hypothetical protein
VIGDDHWKVAEQLGEFFAQVRLKLPRYKNGSGDLDSKPLKYKQIFGRGGWI